VVFIVFAPACLAFPGVVFSLEAAALDLAGGNYKPF
jgi:hypothetical protein